MTAQEQNCKTTCENIVVVATDILEETVKKKKKKKEKSPKNSMHESAIRYKLVSSLYKVQQSPWLVTMMVKGVSAHAYKPHKLVSYCFVIISV